MNKRVTTRAVYDIESGQLLERESYSYGGPWAQAAPPKMFEDESYWLGAILPQITAAAASAVLFTSLLACRVAVAGDEQIPAGNLRGIAEEDYWQNPVAPVRASLYQPLPYLPDPEEVPAGSLVPPVTFPGDEDYWWNPVAPVTSSLYQALPYLPDAEEIAAGSLFGQPDEDFWQNPVAPIVARLYQSLPYLPDTEEPVVPAPAAFIPDEDFWFTPVIQTQPGTWWCAPYLWGQGGAEEVGSGAAVAYADEGSRLGTGKGLIQDSGTRVGN